MTLAIYLRDLSSPRGEAKFLVEVQKETRDDEDENLDDEEVADLFQKFVREAQAKLPLKARKVDVWITMFATQVTIEFPPEFLKLVSQNNWPVTFELND